MADEKSGRPDVIYPFDVSDAGKKDGFAGAAIWNCASRGALDWGAFKFLTSFSADPGDAGLVVDVKIRRFGAIVLHASVSHEANRVFDVRDHLEGLVLCPVFGAAWPLIWESSVPVNVTASFLPKAK